MHRLRTWLEKLSLKWRLILVSFLVVVVSVSLITGVMGVFSYRAISNQVTDARAQLAAFTAGSISDRMQEALRVANLVLSQELVTEAIASVAVQEDYPLSQQIRDAREIVSFTKSLEDSSNLVRVRILLCGDALYANEQVTFFTMTEEEREYLTELRLQGQYYNVSESVFPYIFQNTRHVISVVCPKVDSGDFSVVEGGVAVDIDAQEILELMQNMLVSQGDAAVLYDKDGTVILQTGGEELCALPAHGGVQNEWIGGRDRGTMFYETQLEVGGWLLSYRVNADSMFSIGTELLRSMLLALALVLLGALAMTITSGTAQSRRLLVLAAAMDRVRNGDMDVRVQEGGRNEVGVMEHSFNYLLDELRHMLDGKVEAARQLGILEMRLLQSQIKPHFLYNTLDLICWRLVKNGDEEGARCVQALAQFYRIGLSRGGELIPLEDELRHVQLYVEIQNFRLDSSITLEITLPSDCKDIPVPGNILQPLVENSIGAGIMEKPDGRGTVRISCEKRYRDLEILISDDGVGMDIGMIEELLGQRSDSHYGVWNVNKRLRLRFGERAGLNYSRNEHGGVDVLVRIPWQE